MMCSNCSHTWMDSAKLAQWSIMSILRLMSLKVAIGSSNKSTAVSKVRSESNAEHIYTNLQALSLL